MENKKKKLDEQSSSQKCFSNTVRQMVIKHVNFKKLVTFDLTKNDNFSKDS